jgi:hypothetical protein
MQLKGSSASRQTQSEKTELLMAPHVLTSRKTGESSPKLSRPIQIEEELSLITSRFNQVIRKKQHPRSAL